jgi:hypothetical protein
MRIRSVVISRMEILRRHMRRKVYLCLVFFAKDFAKEKEFEKRPYEYGRALIGML